MKMITDAIITAIVKKGILYEGRNFNTEIKVPMLVEGQEREVAISIKCEHMTVQIDKSKTES